MKVYINWDYSIDPEIIQEWNKRRLIFWLTLNLRCHVNKELLILFMIFRIRILIFRRLIKALLPKLLLLKSPICMTKKLFSNSSISEGNPSPHRTKTLKFHLFGKKILVLTICIFFSFILNAQVLKTLNVTAGSLSTALTTIEL